MGITRPTDGRERTKQRLALGLGAYIGALVIAAIVIIIVV